MRRRLLKPLFFLWLAGFWIHDGAIAKLLSAFALLYKAGKPDITKGQFRAAVFR